MPWAETMVNAAMRLVMSPAQSASGSGSGEQADTVDARKAAAHPKDETTYKASMAQSSESWGQSFVAPLMKSAARMSQ